MRAEQWIVYDFERASAFVFGGLGSVVVSQELDQANPRIEVFRGA